MAVVELKHIVHKKFPVFENLPQSGCTEIDKGEWITSAMYYW